MKFLVAFLMSLFACTVFAQPIVRIQPAPNYQQYSQIELQRRVWDLENAVAQLQQRVFQLEATKPVGEPTESWVCTITAMGNTYTGLGASRGVATYKAIENCKASRGGDGFFCRSAPDCRQ